MSSSGAAPQSIRALSATWFPPVWNYTSQTYDIGDLRGQILTASSFPLSPYIITNIHDPTEFGILGTVVSALHTVCHVLHYRCQLREASYGTSPNDSLNGVLGDLSRGRAQFGIAAFAINQARFTAFDIILSPFQRSYEVIIDRRFVYTDRSASFASALIANCSLEVWIALGLIYFLFVGCFAVAERVHGNIHFRKIGYKHAANIWLIKMLGSVVSNGDMDTSRAYRKLAGQGLLIASWLFWIVIIGNVFQSRFPIMLASGALEFPPFASLDELAESDFAVHGTSNMKWIFQSGPDEASKQIGKNMQLIDVPAEAYSPTVRQLLTSGAKNAIIISNDNHFDLAAVVCHAVIALRDISPRPIAGLVFPKNSPLKKRFQIQYLMAVQAGLVQQYGRYYDDLYGASRELRSCLPAPLPVKASPHFKNVSLPDVLFLVVFLCIIAGVSVFLFLVELLHSNRVSVAAFLSERVREMCWWRSSSWTPEPPE